MKNKIIKIAAIVAAISVIAIASCNAIKMASVVKFSDVPEDFWAYETISEMTQDGLFKGTTEPVNGVGTFSPEKVMTRAEFITVALRAVYPEEMETTQKDNEIWWKSFYNLALDKELVKDSELDNGNLDKPMSREEMAMVLVRAVQQNGEKLTKRVETSRIADYNLIGSYYKDYVRDCFSFGLLCGIDEKGTFAPAKSLTRAEGAEVLCRLLKKDRRIKVDFASGNSGGSGASGGTSTPDISEPEEIVIPWENGGKQPKDYTWAEFEALSAGQQMAFQNSFESLEAFDAWLQAAQTVTEKNPWENGGKQPKDYTWAEFEALSAGQQMEFQNSFGSIEAFDAWLQAAQTETEKNPWESGGKQPKDYTWAEFEALSAGQQMAFQNSFGSIEAFDAWMQEAQFGSEEIPWENGGKQPKDYTWAEFEKLSAGQQMAFQNSFGSIEAFDAWMQEAQFGSEEIPWENGGKLPKDYSMEEFEELSAGQQMKFQEWFGSIEEFDTWLKKAPFSDVSKNMLNK